MKLLVNEAAFKRWSATMGFEPCLKVPLRHAADYGFVRSELIERKASWYAAHSPKKYPCVGYEEVTSFSYEECEPRYLYEDDLVGFLKVMGSIYYRT